MAELLVGMLTVAAASFYAGCICGYCAKAIRHDQHNPKGKR